MVDTLRFLSQNTPECDRCPMQNEPSNIECGDNGCSKLIMSEAAQMLEDDGIILKAWGAYARS